MSYAFTDLQLKQHIAGVGTSNASPLFFPLSSLNTDSRREPDTDLQLKKLTLCSRKGEQNEMFLCARVRYIRGGLL